MSFQDHPVAVMQIQWVCIHNKQSLEFFFFSWEKIVWNCSLGRTLHLPSRPRWLCRIQKGWAHQTPEHGGSEMQLAAAIQSKGGGGEWTGYILLYLLWLSMVSLTILFKLIVFSYLHLPCRHNALNCLEWLAHLWLTYLWLAYFNRNLDSRSMELRDNALYQRNVIGSLGHSYTSIASSLDGFFFRGYRND